MFRNIFSTDCSKKAMNKYLAKHNYYAHKSPLDRYSLSNREKAEKYANLYNKCLEKSFRGKIVPLFGQKRKSKKILKRKSKKILKRKSKKY